MHNLILEQKYVCLLHAVEKQPLSKTNQVDRVSQEYVGLSPVIRQHLDTVCLAPAAWERRAGWSSLAPVFLCLFQMRRELGGVYRPQFSGQASPDVNTSKYSTSG